MEEQQTDVEFLEIAARDRAKAENSAKKTGFKEGSYDGRQSVFQDGFDIGYEQGFRNAFTLGRYQGLKMAYKAMDNQRSSEPEELVDLLLVKPTRGQCQLCVDQQLINKDVTEITDIQTKHAEKVENALCKRYAHLDAFVKSNN